MNRVDGGVLDGGDLERRRLQLRQALAARRHRGHHRHAQLFGQHARVRLALAAAGLVGEIDGESDPVAQVDQLQRQIEAAREVRGVGHGDDDVRPARQQRVARGALVALVALERVGPGQVHDLHAPVAPVGADDLRPPR